MADVYEAWDDFFAGFETGDIILMHGLFISSAFTEAVTGSPWSHSALVVISDDIGLTTVPPGTVLLWESNVLDSEKDNPKGLTVTDVILDKAKAGPMLDHLAQRITNNHELDLDTDVARRKLTFPRSSGMFSALETVIKDMHPDAFPSIPWGEMSHFVEGRLANIPVTDGTCFCSQLVAHTYKAWGILTEKHVDNWYAPANFGAGSWESSLQDGATLGPEIRLDLKTIPPYPGY